MATIPTTYELASRHKKVAALVAKAREFEITADDMQQSMTDDLSWAQLARFAGVNMPSETTRTLAVLKLREMEGRR